MATSKNLQKIRTFNQDVAMLRDKEGADTEIDRENTSPEEKPIPPAQKTSTAKDADQASASSPKKKPVKHQGVTSPENVTKDTNDAQSSLSTKQLPKDKKTSDTGETVDAHRKEIPDEHAESIKETKEKLAKYKGKAEKNIEEAVGTISGHAKSIQDDSESDIFTVGENETTSATIVRDKRIRKRDVLSRLANSFKSWLLDLKNTYITPPKPTYTIDRAERRAGVLRDATSQSGASLVNHSTFAERIRKKYRGTNEANVFVTEEETDPSWLPALPGKDGEQKNVSEVNTVPRKRSTAANDQAPRWESGRDDFVTPKGDKAEEVEKAQATSKEEELSKNTLDNKQPETNKTTPITPKTTDKEAESLPKSKDVQSEEKQAAKPDNNTAEEKTAIDLNNVGVTDTADKQPETTEREAKKEKPVPKREETISSTNNKATDLVKSTAEKIKEEGPVLEKEDTQTEDEQAAEPDNNTAEEKANAVFPPSYTEKDDELEKENSTIPFSQNTINKISVGIVASIVLLSFAGLIGYPLLTNLSTEQSDTTSIPSHVGDETTTIPLANWDGVDIRYNKLREKINTSGSAITQITPVYTDADSTFVLAAKDTFALLDITAPDTFFAVANSVHFGSNQKGIPFLLVRINEKERAFGAMLQWEDTITETLTPLFRYVDTDGVFTDKTIHGVDIRANLREDGTSIIAYAVVEDMIIITTTPTNLESLLTSRP